jgi:sialic acid synthase SpsE
MTIMSNYLNSLVIIAEAAQGFEGDSGLARALVRAAAGAGADALKLQLVYAEELCTPDYKHYELFRSLEMADDVWIGLANYARELKIDLMLDVFGGRSLNLAVAVGAAAVKIHSTDMSNIGLLQEVAASDVPLVLLSTGGCSQDEIMEALQVFAGKNIVLLHGYQGYPTPLEGNQIGRLAELRQLATTSGCVGTVQLGFADHVPSSDPLRFALAGVALGAGASVLEKHMTLALAMKMEDHESALNPDEFAQFVTYMRQCAISNESTPVGLVDFGMHDSERSYRAITRKHVVSLRPLKAGNLVSPDLVGLQRTSSPKFIADLRAVYGRRLVTDVPAGVAITSEMLDGGAA